MKSLLANAEMHYYSDRVLEVLEPLDIGDKLGILGAISAALFERFPADIRGGLADAWFEIIVAVQSMP